MSNHGGNNLDGTSATSRLLPDIARAVGDQVEVLMDGWVRRGGDVVKALTLGAQAVLIGPAYLWGLGANGQAGVENVLDLLRSGIDACLLGLRHQAGQTAPATRPPQTEHAAALRISWPATSQLPGAHFARGRPQSPADQREQNLTQERRREHSGPRVGQGLRHRGHT